MRFNSIKASNAEATKCEVKILDLISEVPVSSVIKPSVEEIISDDFIEQCCRSLQNIYESTAYDAVEKYNEYIYRYDTMTEYAIAERATQIASQVAGQIESGILARYIQNYEYYEKMFRMCCDGTLD